MEKKVILLADDDIDDTEMFCEALEEINEDIICHCASNGKEVFEILNSINEKPELIFLDLNMPIMNGWDCLKLLKKDEKYEDIPVIMISTSSHRKDMEAASGLGSVCYFVKPNNFNDLKEVLRIITSNLGPDLKEAILNLLNSSKHIFTCSDE
ncbi:response regulator [Flavobacterium defluvii]|uniref:Response regulator receiver domain-containing protein n=1 Tax=Flavobacterium defluvii TaxID=370979 RepID=A0A1M5QCJ5_9FLAO|nr:response regulator [Flavobacterium defluvii]SHH11678.1 Response regulator receiver domain-containing protein [Flavobacterium defluvii]